MNHVHPINKALVDVLKRDSEVLAVLQDQFHHWIRPRPTDAPDIFCFYEGHVSGSAGLVSFMEFKPSARTEIC